MSQNGNPGWLAILFILLLVAISIFNINLDGGGGGITGTPLGWFTSHPDIFAVVIVGLVVLGVLGNIAQDF